ncbi:MAG: SEC-C domain-containing protein, partial [Bryobacterales bacterium]|nr:SEC-C domain-containing protein [Bryobacterales bacterium]
SFAPVADLPKIEQYARRIASHKSFEGKMREILINQIAAKEKQVSMSAPNTPVQPSNATLCETKPPQSPQVGRNSTCPCGSGLKFKRCCGVNAPPILNRAA